MNETQTANPTVHKPAGPMAFTFGDPEPVMEGRDILDYVECMSNGRYYEPPIPPSALAKSFRSNPHHSSAIYLKRNLLVSCFEKNSLLSVADFSAWALEFLIFGNAYLEERRSLTGRTVRLAHAPAKYMRRGIEAGKFWFVRGWGEEHEFQADRVHQFMEYDPNQEIYGLPEYLSNMQAAWLNESATLFRRKYYNNGSHAGFILYVSDAAQDSRDVDSIREALKNSKGPGNFKNLFYYSPNGKKDGIQLIPVSEVAAKDDFLNIKKVSRDDVLAAHRVPPQLLGVIPENTGGFGGVIPAASVFVRNELMPLMERMAALNDQVGAEVIRFRPYTLGELAAQVAKQSGGLLAAA
ncbi:phage portal protein [Hylemonella gracilis]|nr:phage portal protein [Hylemonella gracilis]